MSERFGHWPFQNLHESVHQGASYTGQQASPPAAPAFHMGSDPHPSSSTSDAIPVYELGQCEE